MSDYQTPASSAEPPPAVQDPPAERYPGAARGGVAQDPPAERPTSPSSDNVRDIGSGPVDFDLDARPAKRVPDYRLRFDGRWWTVRQPDVGTVLQLEQAPTARVFLQLMFEEQWDELGPLLEAYADASVLGELARGISIHFDLDTSAAPRQNRKDRRAAPRRG